MHPEGCIISLLWAPVQARKGADLTMNAWRPRGCGVEKEHVEEAGYALPTDNMSQLSFKDLLWQK